MSASKVSICSNALLRLGAQTISSFDEDNDRARLASNLWDSAMDAVQRSHPWNCCIARVAMAPDATAPAFDWDYQYTLPSDWLKTMSVGYLGAEESYRIEGRKLLCNANPAYLRYIARNDNPATWDAMLITAMELYMAAQMAYPVTQSSSLADSMYQKSAAHMKRARSVDGQDDTPEMMGDERFLRARY